MIDSIPELRAAYLDAAQSYGEGNSGLRAFVRAGDRLQSARWRLAIEPYRWTRGQFVCVPDYSQRVMWFAIRLIWAWRYAGVVGRPGKAVAVRESREKVGHWTLMPRTALDDDALLDGYISGMPGGFIVPVAPKEVVV